MKNKLSSYPSVPAGKRFLIRSTPMKTKDFLAVSLLLISINCFGQDAQVIKTGKTPRLLNTPYERKEPVIKYSGNTVIVTPAHSTIPLVNPGKGWVSRNPANLPPEIIELTSLGRNMYSWGNIEPEEGVFRWDIIDDDINEWTGIGRDFAFGIRCAWSHSPAQGFWVTPKWVFDAGAKYDTFELKDPKLPTTGTPGLKLVPVFDDPVFLKKLEHFIRALAARYDGNPNLAFIEIRSYGNWGEGHMHPFKKPDISAEQLKEHIMIHRNAFHKTLLILPCGNNRSFNQVYPWAVSIGIGLRRDGICGNSDGSETSICSGKLPAAFETFGSYEMLKKLGWWDGIKDERRNGFRLDECVETGMPTYINFWGERGGLDFFKREQTLIYELNNRMGYHFVLIEAKYPNIIQSGMEAAITLKWENRGVAPIFIPAKVSFALISTVGKIIQVCDGMASIPSSWKSDIPVTVTDKLEFRDVSPGEYILAVKIRRPDDGLKPSIKLGIEQKTFDGWYELGPVKIE